MPAHRKREEELAAPRKERRSTTADVTHGELRSVTIPHAGSDWHPIAKRMYASLRTSGQMDWYQDSDWMKAWVVCNEMSLYQESEGRARSSARFEVLMAQWDTLLPTEEARRKARIELRQPTPDVKSASLTAIEGYKKRLGVAKESD